MQIGIDTGGTFTDFVIFDGTNILTYKLPSTPSDPSQAILEGLGAIIGEDPDSAEIVHGTTVATNALLERKGARVVLITTKGFEDVIEIGRQNRADLYNVFLAPNKPLVEKKLRLGIKERTSYDGKVLTKLDTTDLQKLLSKLKRIKPEVIAISFLHSYANPDHENRVADFLKPLGLPISVSSSILPEFREYERTSTVVTNAYLVPKVGTYMKNLSGSLTHSKLSIMQSNGGVVSPEQAGSEPVRVILSGPAGGVVGGFKVAESIGYDRVITYDMGGTSTDVALCNVQPGFSTETRIDGIPIKVPMIDVTTIGAGGGSIAYFDSGGALKVGPRSAGADPGPACYGKGTDVTVTDANLVLGRVKPERFLGGRMKVFPKKAVSSLKKLSKQQGLTVEELAEGIIQVANANMERALRVISIGRGYDPRDFALLSFGGAGGLHACELAKSMDISTVIFPMNPGVLSALGMLMADTFKDYSQTVFLHSEDTNQSVFETAFGELEHKALLDFSGDRIKYERSLDARYRRQAHEITIPYKKNYVSLFHRIHNQMYGYKKPRSDVEIVTIRLRAVVKKKKLSLPALYMKKKDVQFIDEKIVYKGKNVRVKSYNRDTFYPGYKFSGPGVVLEDTSTLFVPPGYKCLIDEFGNIIASFI